MCYTGSMHDVIMVEKVQLRERPTVRQQFMQGQTVAARS